MDKLTPGGTRPPSPGPSLAPSLISLETPMSRWLTLPSPWPQVPGERWFEAGRISREASRTGTVLSLSADHALWKGCSNPCSSTFHGCQLSAGLREAGF